MSIINPEYLPVDITRQGVNVCFPSVRVEDPNTCKVNGKFLARKDLVFCEMKSTAKPVK